MIKLYFDSRLKSRYTGSIMNDWRTPMIKILFVCHGNICRSPMAEFVMKDLLEKTGREYEFEISSAATSTEEIWNGIGNPVYPPAKKLLAKKGIDCSGKRARQMTRADYDYYDLLIGMDNFNIRNMLRITGGDPCGKIRMLLDFTNRPGEVADPWYSGDFETTYRDVLEGCEGILLSLPSEQSLRSAPSGRNSE